MSLYCIGDLQGCLSPFQRLLEKIDFSPSRDTLFLLGDLVNRGPDSLGVLRSLTALGDAAQCLLGNHDLHLLALWQGVRKPGRKDTVQDVLQAPERDALLDWLRQWHDGLQGADRLRVIVNALTRLRFCTPQGVMDFTSTESAAHAPPGYMPWFEVPGRATHDMPTAFGHWSTLVTDARRHTGLHNNALPLDTGCVWGGCLSAARLEASGAHELIQVSCEQVQKPGK